MLIIASTALVFKSGAADLPPATQKALRSAGVPQAAVAAWVQEIGAPRPTIALHPDTPVNPASVMKLVTTYAALELLGPT